MNHKIEITLFILFAFSHFMYAQGNPMKLDPSPLKKPALSQFNTDQTQLLPELKNQAYVGTQTFDPQQDNEWVEQCLNLSLDQKNGVAGLWRTGSAGSTATGQAGLCRASMNFIKKVLNP